MDIGEFNLETKNIWQKNPREPEKVTKEKGLELFLGDLKRQVCDEFVDGSEDYWNGDYAEDRTALIRASVVPNDFIKNYDQNIAEEYLVADGFELVAEFDNVNSSNTVKVYQKVCPVGAWLKDIHGNNPDD